MGIAAKNPYENDDIVTSDASGEVGAVLTEIDHVAIAVYDLDEAIDEHRESFGVWVDHREILEAEGVEVALLRVADNYIQLLAPTRDDSRLAAFLEARGAGLHHVGYRVDDCAAVLAALIEAGHEVVDTEPRPGLRGSTVAFIHPHTMFGTLVQLVEP
jgi:methylmalonyl-CoA epimerase